MWKLNFPLDYQLDASFLNLISKFVLQVIASCGCIEETALSRLFSFVEEFFKQFYISLFRNEQLRDGLLSLVHSYSLLENKLDRHEQRERALGDQLKRGLQGLQKGQKSFEPMRGTFTRLDERMSQIETVLMAQDEKLTDQQTKISKTLESILKWMTEHEAAPAAKQVVDESDEDSGESVGEKLSKQVSELADNIKALRAEIAAIATKQNEADEKAQDVLKNTEKIVNSNSTVEVITRIEEKLKDFYVTSPVNVPAAPERDSAWEDNVAKSLQEIKTNIVELKNNVPQEAPAAAVTLDKEFFVTLANETLDRIEDMRIEVLTASDKSFTKTATRIKESADNLDSSINDVLKTVAESATATETFNEAVITSMTGLQKDVDELNKLEMVLLTMGDNILSIKRGMEFNVHAITLELGDVIKSSSSGLNDTISQQFSAINQTILENHNGALTNLTSKIETEISQVWRQIGIMYQEVSSSKQALDKLQEQTEAYVNGTFTTMDSMEGKVWWVFQLAGQPIS